MKNTLLSLFLLATVLFSRAQTTTTSAGAAKTKAGGTFWHHSGEITVTPSADYFIYAKGKNYQQNKPYEYRLPFIGFNISGQYMYRPVEVFAVSAGLGFRMQGNFLRMTDYFLGKKYVSERDAVHMGYLSVPIEFHLFKQMPKCTFEFATGPQFNFPVLAKYTATYYNVNGDKTGSDKSKDKFSTSEMREFSTLGWNILLGAELHLADHADMFIGPQINFVNLAYFDKDLQTDRKNYGDDFNCSLGLKLGFRIHCEP